MASGKWFKSITLHNSSHMKTNLTSIGKKLHTFFGGWIGIVLSAILMPVIIVNGISGRFTIWGTFMCIGFVWVFSWGAHQENLRKDRERKEVQKLREDNHAMRTLLIVLGEIEEDPAWPKSKWLPSAQKKP